jgi:hypothetical protein
MIDKIPHDAQDAFNREFDEGILAAKSREFPEQIVGEQMAMAAYSAGLLVGNALRIADVIGEVNALDALAAASVILQAHFQRQRENQKGH